MDGESMLEVNPASNLFVQQDQCTAGVCETATALAQDSALNCPPRLSKADLARQRPRDGICSSLQQSSIRYFQWTSSSSPHVQVWLARGIESLYVWLVRGIEMGSRHVPVDVAEDSQ